MKRAARLLGLSVVVGLAVMFTGCEGGGDDGGGPAGDLTVQGFWEGVAPDGSVCAGTFNANGGSVTGPVKVERTGTINGTVNGYAFTFTIAYDGGETVSGTGEFHNNASLTGGYTGTKLVATIPSGEFFMEFRGPSYENHTPLYERPVQ